MMAMFTFAILSAMLLQSCWSAPAYPGAYNNFNNYNNYNGVYNPAYDGASFDPHPRYNFDYRVAEPRTGDYKNHQESRDGDAVRGSYSVAEPDGSLLTVRYAADDANGYTAVVERSGHGGTIVQNFPGPAPLPVAATQYVSPARAPFVPVTPLPAPIRAPVFAPGYEASAAGAAAAAVAANHANHANHHGLPRPAPFAYGGYGTSSTSFNGPHAAYSYTN